MKIGMITIAAGLGLLVMAPAPARADHGIIDIAFHLGPAYVRYRDGYHRVDRIRHYDVRRHGYYRPYRHWRTAHDLWHRCHDGRWYRYYDRKHWRYHDKRGRGHKHRGRGRGRHR